MRRRLSEERLKKPMHSKFWTIKGTGAVDSAVRKEAAKSRKKKKKRPSRQKKVDIKERILRKRLQSDSAVIWWAGFPNVRLGDIPKEHWPSIIEKADLGDRRQALVAEYMRRVLY